MLFANRRDTPTKSISRRVGFWDCHELDAMTALSA